MVKFFILSMKLKSYYCFIYHQLFRLMLSLWILVRFFDDLKSIQGGRVQFCHRNHGGLKFQGMLDQSKYAFKSEKSANLSLQKMSFFQRVILVNMTSKKATQTTRKKGRMR